MTHSKTDAATVRDMTSSRSNGQSRRAVSHPFFNRSNFMQRILPEDLFLGILCLERKRAERSGNKFLLLLLDAEEAAKTYSKAEVLKGMVKAAEAARRETDPAGWYKEESILGIIFTELGAVDGAATVNRLLRKIHEALAEQLSAKDLQKVHVSMHVFSDGSNDQGPSVPADPILYPDLFHPHDSKKVTLLLKRVMDIVGSAAALILLSPAFILIAVLIKLSSKGPIFFKQERLGQFGKQFEFLKFRSMHASNDAKIHQEFMKRVIRGSHGGDSKNKSKTVYKMTDDPRVTRVGRFLRRTSLDEVPQFINVLKGDMSLVGPRPPIPYEYEEYDLWHRRRVLEVRPGITGLWQVKGRSHVAFDDMVRLDLRYARGWSLWLDIQILMRTPRAVVLGDGAY
jgi:exopolysaccharide biosynthesis polyprenyl glycosylphosphotransferase